MRFDGMSEAVARAPIASPPANCARAISDSSRDRSAGVEAPAGKGERLLRIVEACDRAKPDRPKRIVFLVRGRRVGEPGHGREVAQLPEDVGDVDCKFLVFGRFGDIGELGLGRRQPCHGRSFIVCGIAFVPENQLGLGDEHPDPIVLTGHEPGQGSGVVGPPLAEIVPEQSDGDRAPVFCVGDAGQPAGRPLGIAFCDKLECEARGQRLGNAASSRVAATSSAPASSPASIASSASFRIASRRCSGSSIPSAACLRALERLGKGLREVLLAGHASDRRPRPESAGRAFDHAGDVTRQGQPAAANRILGEFGERRLPRGDVGERERCVDGVGTEIDRHLRREDVGERLVTPLTDSSGMASAANSAVWKRRSDA